jgi:hypothetical protein
MIESKNRSEFIMVTSKLKDLADQGRIQVIPPRKYIMTDGDKAKLKHDLDILTAFTEVYCRKTHGTAKGELCDECGWFLKYAHGRRIKCPLHPKPKCKECPVHCYSPKMRLKVREVMRVGGMYFVMHGRIDWLLKYFFLSRFLRKA